MNNDVKKLFDAKSDYDERRDKYYFERRTRELEKLLSTLPRKSRILDVGCGTGIAAHFIRNCGFPRVFGSDISRTLLLAARQKNINVVLTGEIALPFRSSSFDIVTMFDVVEHMDSYWENLREVHRILAPNGVVFISYPNPHMIWLLDMLALVGLKIPGKENRVPLEEIRNKTERLFAVETFRPIVLVSKLPGAILRLFEALERIMPRFLLKRIALSYTLTLRKIQNVK